ncbi:hypothetical protein BCU68_13640 [Vibrio sp. 10N.286.49.B3]|uniref:Uncharacterized protein n=1 Tax=Vibrio lentus TaxID=136468 RepID=A0AB36XND6_9VIBR|nr:hypothetical protein BCV43_06725 [Vibrio cyclitrophicus]PMH42635.1 hypothetical protein BCU68_13640 [Vibrio sp. 10N.286.49.B3]PMI17410.1 hypothetical protein BCU51_01390 [Vibrio lentus]TKF90064.1 hypothetical protein FCV73_14130 [Vibrio sp. F13]PMF54653.1 hypothetical protein BCV12_13690 [Vibrio cyclitrophicus]
MVNIDLSVPELKEFILNDSTPFKVVDPTSLPQKTQLAMCEFMRGKTAPHLLYIYSHDYASFRNLVISGKIIIK